MIVGPLAFALALALASPQADPQIEPQTEPWADASLPVRDGLALWLDAGRQASAYAAAQRQPPVDGAGLGVWYDASGRRRDLVQRERGAQPRFVVPTGLGVASGGGGGALVRFDGVDDVVAASGLGETLDEFTLFVRAAPRSNGGGFRGLVAANATGRNDYRSGFTLDLSWAATSQLETINVEGSAFLGAVDLCEATAEFRSFHTFTVTVARATAAGEKRSELPPDRPVALFLDGVVQGTRPRDATPIRMDELSVGARFYSNTSDLPTTTGFLDGDVAELLLYERALAPAEREQVERWLAAKWAPLEQALAKSARLRRVELEPAKPPSGRFPVVLVPGFTARALPLELNNVNGLRYREDGTLVALGYDGNVWLLDDRDGDGLAESRRRFFENRGSLAAPIGMALTPPGYRLGRGLFVACKGKLVLLADQDGDDVAEREIVVAEGWIPGAIPHDVDALGVAVAPDGRLFFGLGAADYTNAYLRDADGEGHYDLASERGTILEVAADFSSRRVFCTGIRFPVGLAFDRAGELFATDQEGATWLANGNPFDELLHIVEGRHYGFPPRHPRFLPRVIDEPSLFDYGPQHESTCGLCFDEPRTGGRLFGPPQFEGNVLVAGYSRGKLFRTELAQSRAGRVARNHLLARFDMLVCDVALAPDGGLIVAAHGGGPDWGSGPAGEGRLYRLDWSEPETPQPLFAWAAGPQEVRVAFDRPLDPTRFEGVALRTRITFGEAVAAADRFEVHRPGYAVVERQLAAPRFDLAVQALRVTDERRTLLLRTEPHVQLAPHALELPERDGARTQAGALACDLAYDVGGLDAGWRARDGDGAWSGWLPHPDLAVARAFTARSRDHELAWRRFEQPGTLTLRGALDLADLLRPKVQPGARIDYAWPDEEVVLEFRARGALTVKLDGARVEQVAAGDGASDGGTGSAGDGATDGASDATHVVRAMLATRGAGLVPIELTLATGGGPPVLDVSFRTAEDARPRPLELRRILPPWAMTLGASGTVADAAGATPRPELAGGNWERGRRVFFGDDAMCSRCHTLDDGTASAARGRIGPDLSQVWQRDLASLRKDVLNPNASLNPDHLAYAIRLADGRELAGVPRSATSRDGSGRAAADAGALIVGEAGGKETTIRASDVVAREPLTTSIMPSGLQNVLSEPQQKDLFTYLLTPPLRPAPIAIAGAPPPRARGEIDGLFDALLGDGSGTKPRAATDAASAAATSPIPPPLHVVLVAGPKDHGVDEHDYPDWQQRWLQLLACADGVTVEAAQSWPGAAQLASADVLVIYSANPGWSAARGAELEAYLARGGGLVLLHYAVNGRDAVPELAQRVGLAWRDGGSRFRHGAVDLQIARGAADHPITRGLGATPLRFVDETYWELERGAGPIDVLATSLEDGRPQPQLWTREAGRGRVVACLLGHYRWTFDDPLFRLLLLRAFAWSAHQPADRLAALAEVGARIAARE